MNTPRGFRQEQRGVALAMGGALVVTILVLGGVAVSTPARALPFVDRMQHTLQADLFVVAWLAAAIANVARLRFFSPGDIAGSSAGAGSDAVRNAGAILQNSFEQTGLAIVTHLIVAATFSRSFALTWALVALFSAGRLLFWIGYRHGAKGRAFGFALTFYPSVVALLFSGANILLGHAA